ncbi:MAG: gamma carbonic anhydrase family protein [Xanthomonadaceae bacterium]|nr:gamma carbonic anhydrase family protein [Xanthomonadaceae bacterium]
MILPHHGKSPEIHETAFIAPSADVIGEVAIGEQSSVWFQVVIRGDVNHITIGSRTNIQDHSMLHVTRKVSPLVVGDEVTVGHRVTLHGCKVGNRVLVGMGATLLDDCVIGDDCMIGAGSLVTKGKSFPNGSLIMGAPAKVARPLTPEELAFLRKSADNYVKDSAEYRGYVRGPKVLGQDTSDLEQFDSDDEEDF